MDVDYRQVALNYAVDMHCPASDYLHRGGMFEKRQWQSDRRLSLDIVKDVGHIIMGQVYTYAFDIDETIYIVTIDEEKNTRTVEVRPI